VVLGDPAYYGRFGFSVAAAARLATPYPAEFTGLLALRDGVAGRAARLIYPTAFAEV
jgi:putative acetyltransferase